jgi:DNA-binding NarL/FixJ family response regulator
MNFETPKSTSPESSKALRAVCIARHSYLSEHIARYFAEMGVVTSQAVGLGPGGEVSLDTRPDVVICDYDLLAGIPLEVWERDALLSKTPVVAVSLTRRCQDMNLLEVNGIAGFLYLPTLEAAAALKILRAAACRPRYSLPLSTAPRTVERS